MKFRLLYSHISDKKKINGFSSLDPKSKNNERSLFIDSLKVSRVNKYAIIFLIFLFSISLIWIICTYSFKSQYPVIFLTLHPTLTHKVSKNFLSLGFDSSLLRDFTNLPIKSKQFITLTQYLSPAYIRFGGTSADCVQFKTILSNIQFTDKRNINFANTVDDKDISNFTITSQDYLSLYEFTKKAGIQMIFDLNVLLRNSNGAWDNSNAKEIINFSRKHKMELDWQLGNEPNSFQHVFNTSLTPKQLAQDYCNLRKILSEMGYKKSILIGPESNHIGDEQHSGEKYIEDFLKNSSKCINAVSWHQYYLNGRVALVTDFINPKVFNRLPAQIDVIANMIRPYEDTIPMWISETSSAFGGGAPELSNRFVAGFLWLDKLGYSAKAKIQVVIRQSLFGGNYAMIGSDLIPNPDWWVAVLYKQLVSNTVLNLATPDNFGYIRLYAHCTPKNFSKQGKPSITIYGVNLLDSPARISIQGPSPTSKFLAYFLTSSNLKSREIMLNGIVLKLKSNGRLPKLKPKILESKEIITLPAYSMIFLIIDGIEIPDCYE